MVTSLHIISASSFKEIKNMRKLIAFCFILCICSLFLFAQGSPETPSVDTSAYDNVPSVLSDAPSNYVIESFWFDNVKLENSYEVTEFGIFTPIAFGYVDKIQKFYERSGSAETISSGNEADFAVLKMDITNRSRYTLNFLDDVYVKVVYDDLYEFEGWSFQFNYDMSQDILLNGADIFGISPMYTGHYIFGCTLPNSIKEDSAPLQMIISFGDNEIVYNIR